MTIQFDSPITVKPFTPGLSQISVLLNASRFCFQSAANNVCSDDGFGGHGSQINENADWQAAELASSSSLTSINVILNEPVFGVRYGFTGGGDCCVGRAPTSAPCLPASCPLMSGEDGGSLPANPFMVKIVNGKCACMPPMVCN